MDTDDENEEIFAIDHIGKRASLTAGYYKVHISLQIRPKRSENKIGHIFPIIKDVFTVWWKELNTGVTILRIESEKEKIKKVNNLPLEYVHMDKFWTVEKK